MFGWEKKVTGGCRGGLWVKSGTAASVFNLQTGARKRRKKRLPSAASAFQGPIVADAPSSLCSKKKGAANTEEFTVG